jgi:plastocyanin
LLVAFGCQSAGQPAVSGQVVDVAIAANEEPGRMVVHPGDEIRWVNKRHGPVRLILLDRLPDEELSCKRHFGGLMGSSDTASLQTDETASVCFRHGGTYTYVIRMPTEGDAGEVTLRGVIQVVDQGPPARVEEGRTVSVK